MKLTEKGAELITSIRNYKKGYPRSNEILLYIETLISDLLDY